MNDFKKKKDRKSPPCLRKTRVAKEEEKMEKLDEEDENWQMGI